MTTRNLLMLLTLAAVAVISWLAGAQRRAGDGNSIAPAPVQRGYYILEARIFGSDDNGEPMYELNARRALQSARGEPIELEQVQVAYAGDNDSGSWRISAINATLDESTSQLVLSGDVVATRLAAQPGDEVRLSTERLAYDPRGQVVETDERVRFELGAGSLVATGMRASLADNTIELRSNISGQFTP